MHLSRDGPSGTGTRFTKIVDLNALEARGVAAVGNDIYARAFLAVGITFQPSNESL